MPVEYVTRESLGLAPIKHRQDLIQAKISFVERQTVLESMIIQNLRRTDDIWDRYASHRYPTEFDVRKAIHDHKCFRHGCKRIIKKGNFYFRRSFGRLWTIKACSIRCFLSCLPS